MKIIGFGNKVIGVGNKQYERMPFMIREIVKNDLDGLLKLYMQLHDNPMPEKTDELLRIWDSIFQDKNHHVIVAEENGEIVSPKLCKEIKKYLIIRCTVYLINH